MLFSGQTIDQGHYIAAQHPVVISPFQDAEASAAISNGGVSNLPAGFQIIFGFEDSAPIIFMIVEAGGNADDIGPATIHFFCNFIEIGIAIIGFDVVDGHPVFMPQNVDGSVSVMKVDIQHISGVDFFCAFRTSRAMAMLLK